MSSPSVSSCRETDQNTEKAEKTCTYMFYRRRILYLVVRFALYGAQDTSFQQGFDLMLQPGDVFPSWENPTCSASIQLCF